MLGQSSEGSRVPQMPRRIHSWLPSSPVADSPADHIRLYRSRQGSEDSESTRTYSRSRAATTTPCAIREIAHRDTNGYEERREL
ncbi:hypothetical protein PZA11_000933 [Diplocarpon coronariae]